MSVLRCVFPSLNLNLDLSWPILLTRVAYINWSNDEFDFEILRTMNDIAHGFSSARGLLASELCH